MKQKPSSARIFVPLLVGVIALGIVAAMMRGTKEEKSATPAPTPAPAPTRPAEATEGEGAAAQAPPAEPAAQKPAEEAASQAPAIGAQRRLVARAVSANAPFAAIGSLDPAQARMRVEFSPNAAGIARIVFSDYWDTATASREAAGHAADPARSLPPNEARYALRPEGQLPARQGSASGEPVAVPIIGCHSIEVNGTLVDVFGAVWSESAPGRFETLIQEEGDGGVRDIALVRRSFALAGDGFDLLVTHEVESRASEPITVRFWLYGPGDLTLEQGGLLDVRRFQMGHLLSPERDPAQSTVVSHDGMLDRSSLLSLTEESGNTILWPVQDKPNEALSWLGSTNRYFSLAVHAPVGEAGAPAGKVLSGIETVYAQRGVGQSPALFSILKTSSREVAPGGTSRLEFAAYAGPLARNVLLEQQPYESLGMVGLIVYQMSGCCSWCTFAWLANGLVIFLEVLHDYVFFDWALAIIALVIVVRLALHPLTRKSQIQMQKMGRLMSTLKPQIEEIQKRYRDDPKRIQQEQMRLYAEYGVNPLGCLGGFLPMFMQMPIWIALYAVLYLAFELRQQAAFFGLFQHLDGWVFLGDLSAPDRFISFGRTFDLWAFTIDSINLVPLLMGAVFFIQQKYMQPPTMGTLTPEQEQQQKMMKWMTVLLFPIMLYKAPSGLTLYIMTSTLIGIWESKRIRAEVAAMDLSPKKRDAVKPKDALGRRYAEALERLRSRGEKKRDFKDRE